MSFCSHFNLGACKSCSLIETPYEIQIKEKEARLQSIVNIPIEATTTSSEQDFRQKIKIAVSGDLSHPILGLAQREGSLELYDCPIQSSSLNLELKFLYEFIKKWNLTPYSITERRGELKSLILSHSPLTGEMMLRFVVRSKESLDRIRLGLNELKPFKVVSVNIQPIPHAILEGTEEIILSTDQFITHRYGDIQIFYGPQSFMQTNLAVAQLLYATAKKWVEDFKLTCIADLFCGSGSFALHLADPMRQVHGYEISSEAVSLAIKAADQQKLNAHFMAAPAESVFKQLAVLKPELVVVNPPRRGLANSLQPLMELAPPHILYSSCSPESLEADLKSLFHQYRPLKTQLFDMFPHTNHFESLTLLARK